MKHLVMLLLILSFIPGIGAISLGTFLYVKDKKPILKYLIYADSFLLAFVLFDIINYYFVINLSVYPELLITGVIIVLLAISLGFIYYLTQFTYKLCLRTFKRSRIKHYFIFFAAVMFINVILLYTLYINGIIEGFVAVRLGFFMSNVFIAIGGSYNAIVLFRHREKMNALLRTSINKVVIIASITIPLSIIVNVIDFFVDFGYAIPLSPISFFLLNLVVIQVFSNSFASEKSKKYNAMDLSDNINQKQWIKNCLSQYSITERELEIIELIDEGLSNQKIGEKLFISPNTVKNHIYRIYKKLSIKSRYELMSLLTQNRS